MIALLLSIALLAAAPAAGETATPAKSEKAKKDGLVCRKEAVVGSRMKSRVCLPQAEWDQRAADAKSALDAVQRYRPHQSN